MAFKVFLITTTTYNTSKNKCNDTVRILLDSGASKTFIRKDILTCQKRTKTKNTTKWNTMAGTFKRSEIATVKFKVN